MSLVKKEISQAMALFFHQGYGLMKIAALTGLGLDEVKALVYGKDGNWQSNPKSWMHIKTYQPESMTVISPTQYQEIEPILFSQTKAKALRAIERAVDRVTEDEELDLDDAMKLTNIFTAIDKVDRLEKGKATNITSTELDRMEAVDIVAERRRRWASEITE